MKRLLLVSYFFPPDPAAGSLRCWYVAKYLPDFGWEPVVITRQFPGEFSSPYRVIRTSEVQFSSRHRSRLISEPLDRRRAGADAPTGGFIKSLVKSIVFFPDSTVGWFPAAAIQAVAQSRKSPSFDAILSSAMPATAHMVASLTARLTSVPWVADFRDPWVGSRYDRHGPIRTAIESQFERLVMKPAAALTAVSESIAAQLRSRHPNKRIRTISNGFDPNDWADVPSVRPQQFSIAYTGVLYGGQRTPDLIFAAGARLVKAGHPAAKSMVFDFYGPDTDVVANSAASYGISSQVRIQQTIPRQESLRVQRSSAALLVILKMDPDTADELGSKIFEYAAAGRPIIAVGPRESIVRRVIESNQIGWYASNEDECVAALESAAEHFLQGDYSVPPGRLTGMSTARDMASSFAALLNSLVP